MQRAAFEWLQRGERAADVELPLASGTIEGDGAVGVGLEVRIDRAIGIQPCDTVARRGGGAGIGRGLVNAPR